MDNSGSRLYLNFGNSNDRLASSERAFPTTPSTFPQPVFQSQSGASNSGQNPPAGAHQGQSQSYAGGGYAAPNYFANQNPYQSHYAQGLAPQSAEYGASAASAAYAPSRSSTPGTSNDPNTGLAHQFSHQNLGGAARASPYSARGHPANTQQRPRTANPPTQQANYSYLNAPLPSQAQQPLEFAAAPERNPDRYGPTAHNNQKKCSQLASDFFKDSVKRARERNQRCVTPPASVAPNHGARVLC